MKTIIAMFAVVFGLSACANYDYLADITKDTHSGCFNHHTNYMGFTEDDTYIHLGDNSAAVNASPACSGITSSSGVLPSNSGTGVIPVAPAPVGTKPIQ